MSTAVRQPVAAGSLYASDSQELRAEIDAAINRADTEFTGPKIMVVPDCGLAMAPTTTGNCMIMLEGERDHVERVVVIADHVPGLSEREFSGIAIPRSIAFRTPLGDLLIDRELVEQLQTHPNVVLNDRPFERDTSIEVHLPPVQRLLGAVRVLPVLVGQATTAQVVDVLERVWGGRDTLILVSASFGTGPDPGQIAAVAKDARQAFLQNDLAAIAASKVSSPRTLAAAMTIVGRRSMGLLELAADAIASPRNSSHVTEVASFAAWESADMTLGPEDIAHLRALATAAVHLTVLGGRAEGTDMSRIPPALSARRASVVTLRRGGQTRGSAGTIEADRALAGSVVRNAAAACADPRLASIQPAELDGLDMTISVVSPIERIFPQTWAELSEMLKKDRHGVLVTTATGRGAQLPAMWSRLPSHEEFVGTVARKANVVAPDRVTDAAWYRFETIDY